MTAGKVRRVTVLARAAAAASEPAVLAAAVANVALVSARMRE